MTKAPTTIAAYEVEGASVHPTPYAAGPWSAENQHGASAFGLLTRFIERVPASRPMRITRVTADLSRAVPVAPCTVHTTLERDGRRVQSISATIEHEGTVVARAVATRIRTEPGLVPPHLARTEHAGDAPPPFPDSGDGFGSARPSFHDCLEVRVAEQAEDGASSVVWYRLAHPLVAGEEPTPTVRVAAIADMVRGPATRLGPDWIAINPELSLQLEREPVGEWLAVATTMRMGDDGIGVTEAVLFDRRGRIGRSSKSVLNDPRT